MRMVSMGVAALAACLSLSTAAAAEEFPKMNLRLAHYINATVPQSQVDAWWADEIRRRTGGKVKISFFWSESLGKSTELLDLVASGGVDMASTSPAYYPARLPYSAATHLPLLLKDNRQAQSLQSDLMALPALQNENRRNKVVPLLWHSLPTYHLICTKPVRTIDDFKGLKIRSYGEYIPVMWKALNAVGVNVLAPEVYEGLQRGNIDCAFLPPDFMVAYKLYEPAKYIIDINFGAISAWPIYVGQDRWKTMPDAVKTVITDVSAEAAEKDRETVFAAASTAMERMKKEGVQMVAFQDTDRLRAAIPDMLTLWVENMTKAGEGDGARAVAQAIRDRIQSGR